MCLVDVDQMVDRVEGELDHEEDQHRDPPRAQPDRGEEDCRRREVVRGGVADVVVVLDSERPDLREEGAGSEDHQRSQCKVIDADEDQRSFQ